MRLKTLKLLLGFRPPQWETETTGNQATLSSNLQFEALERHVGPPWASANAAPVFGRNRARAMKTRRLGEEAQKV